MFIVSLFFSFIFLGTSQAYITSIHVPAVLGNTNTGTISVITLNISAGNGIIKILGPLNVGQSTLTSAITGVKYAASYLNMNESKYNFTYEINDNLSNVTGPSAGLAFTLLAISGLTQKPLKQNFTLTGTISSNGQVGPIGGVTDKVSAAKESGLDYVIVPYVQNGSFEDTLYYISQQLNVIPIIEVTNVSQAIKYAFTNQTPVIRNLNYSIQSSNYSLDKLQNAPFNCNCNESYFNNLVNYTLNITNYEINQIPNNFSTLKNQFYSELTTYRNISKKGYGYTAADSAFIEYINAFIYANTKNYTLNKAYNLYNNVLSYCNNLTPPNMNPENFQYIISGQARQSWAEQNLITAKAELNSTQSTDNIIEAISTIGESVAWCGAANNLFEQASSVNKNSSDIFNYTFSNAIKKLTNNDLKTLATNYSQSLYYDSALSSYNNSEYGSALYSIYYLMAQNAPINISNYNTSTLISSLNNTVFGIWPVEYGNSAAFYSEEASLSNNSISQSYLYESYQLYLISNEMSNLNRLLINNLTIYSVNASTSSISLQENQLLGLIGVEANQINSLKQTINNIQFSIELIIVMVVILLIALIYSLAKEFSLRKALVLAQSQTQKKKIKKGNTS
ncbi:MAG: S16 family serine protease [Candidatus Micrarchaeaceae archaeon]